MLTKTGVKVIEYNARFGDPEAINILALLQSDFVAICEAMLAGTLDQAAAQFSPDATVCQYIVPNGYPDKPVKNQAIDTSALTDDMDYYYAAVDQQQHDQIMTGSRALAVLGQAQSLAAARQQAAHIAQMVKGPVFYRNDIGDMTLIKQKTSLLQPDTRC